MNPTKKCMYEGGEDEVIRNYNTVNRPSRVNTRDIRPIVFQTDICKTEL